MQREAMCLRTLCRDVKLRRMLSATPRSRKLEEPSENVRSFVSQRRNKSPRFWDKSRLSRKQNSRYSLQNDLFLHVTVLLYLTVIMSPYIQHETKAVEDKRFSHMMAIALDPKTSYKRGVIRCITSREGNVEEKGYIDRSELYAVEGHTLEHFVVGERLNICNEEKIVDLLSGEKLDYLGLEDPDVWTDENTGLTHLYFTMPFVSKEKEDHLSQIHLGHAVGKDLDSLEMTLPALQADRNGKNTAKEVSIAPLNSKGVRLNLFESSSVENKIWYSTIRVGIAEDMNKPWEFGETIFHPKDHNIPWAGGHASPGPLFSNEFINVGDGKLLGIMNGREANQQIGDKIKYGMFSVGLFIYD